MQTAIYIKTFSTDGEAMDKFQNSNIDKTRNTLYIFVKGLFISLSCLYCAVDKTACIYIYLLTVTYNNRTGATRSCLYCAVSVLIDKTASTKFINCKF